MNQYPKHRYRPAKNEKGYEVLLVNSKEAEAAIKGEHYASPAEFNVETHPAKVEAPVVSEFILVPEPVPGAKGRRSAS